ncbi:hypothetical protein [Brasilonema sp. UFV-L1]|uniref:hypothetical protein n=1 Tax=Brasilonema sp. UFV-L1 TaxID=2234130 RepID=UPI00145DA6E0|nr:hypothetical protein [Brasilonema sp. UFV-L1]NMG05454.1 hypothetical protein [Brasilonema sp. UFV-L1]
MINISLDDETEKYLVEILAQEKSTSSELMKRLIHEHWQKLQPRKTVLERMGGEPQHLLNGPSNLSDRDERYKYLAEYFQKRYEQRQQKQEA